MLKEIRCSKFNKKVIEFTDGLNVILGDNLASNSIGKTTMLLIIDFVFGGNSYITNKHDAIENLGHHEFEFKFVFDDEQLFFKRDTENYMFVNICDSNYNKTKEITLKEYKDFLTEKYKLNYLEKSFRSIVGNYSRIWGKDNCYVDKPLKQRDSKIEECINNLIKLFNKYYNIETLERQLKKIEGKNDAIKKAVKNELIPSINKMQYLKNQKELEELNNKIEKFKKNMDDTNLNLDSLISDEVFELREEKSKLYMKKNQISNRIKRLESNLNSEDLKINTKINKLVEFFPNINMNKLNEINDFHKKMSTSLKNELKTEIENLKAILVVLENDISKIETEIESKISVKNIPNYNVERLADLLTKKNTLEQINQYYNEQQKTKSDVSVVKADLKIIKNQIISEIANTINIEMYELFRKIYAEERKSPTFSMTIDSYSLKRANDSGTGSSYINLIAFDLAIFIKTELPFIIHDSILFKNIEVNAFENLVNIYDGFKKQVFISIDEINKFDTNTQNILENKSIVKLSKENTLFIKNWKIEK